MLDLLPGIAQLSQPAMPPQECSSIVKALDLINCSAIWLDRDGLVLTVTGRRKVFDSDFFVQRQRLFVSDYQSRMRLEELINRVRRYPASDGPAVSQLVINRSGRRPIVMKAILLERVTSACDAGVLLLLTDLDEVPAVPQTSLMAIFDLTPVQAQLASLLVTGQSLDEIAREMNISKGTARNHPKAVFLRTATGRQGELVSLLSRLRQ
ncbi:DNA-binding CsgD family transcriptional regulator [Bradyrhizobium macuxiense]|uniref:DNA-binding CsgD family transcriptional regulator n=1 Tax=Bradyrhizobium macuxiense TaxID=1755647 RepID=A0A560LC93_9BRAD|nr:helix-turn-helix transcriptional regulator [Bradyrhizobium macuxiense]TWB92965.1 DNA-binding CsgD family transcriptional regulator [Bradyrhizobium macuxiense]